MVLACIFAAAAVARGPKMGRATKRVKQAIEHYQTAEGLFKSGDFERAIREYQEALLLDSDEPYWRLALGMAFEKKGNREAALEQYLLASKLSPHDSGLSSAVKRLQGGSEAREAVRTATNKVDANNGPFSVGGNVNPPIAVYKPEPPYSEKALKAKWRGTTVLWIVVDQEGNVSDVRVVKPLGLGLDEKAIDTVRAWKFTPATRNGVPVSVHVSVEISFNI